MASRSAASSLFHSRHASSSATAARWASASCCAPLGHLGAQGGGELSEERCDRIGLVEELASVTDRGDRRCDSLGDRQPVGVAEQAMQVAPCGLALLALLVGGSPAFEVGAQALVIVGDLRGTAGCRRAPARRRGGRCPVLREGAAAPPARPARSLSCWRSAGSCAPSWPGSYAMPAAVRSPRTARRCGDASAARPPCRA